MEKILRLFLPGDLSGEPGFKAELLGRYNGLVGITIVRDSRPFFPIVMCFSEPILANLGALIIKNSSSSSPLGVGLLA